MGQAANVIDWTDRSGEFDVVDRGANTLPPEDEVATARADSAVLPRSPRSREQDEADGSDEPTLRVARAEAPQLPPDSIAELDRATRCAVVRLAALLAWVAEEEPASEVVSFVTAFLDEIANMNRALDGLKGVLRASPSPAFRMTGEAFLRAAALWRARLVDHVDELALTQHRSLKGWSSLPEYSAIYTLAFVMPALDSVKDWTVAARVEGEGSREHVRDVETAMVELNWMLKSAATGRPIAR